MTTRLAELRAEKEAKAKEEARARTEVEAKAEWEASIRAEAKARAEAEVKERLREAEAQAEAKRLAERQKFEAELEEAKRRSREEVVSSSSKGGSRKSKKKRRKELRKKKERERRRRKKEKKRKAKEKKRKKRKERRRRRRKKKKKKREQRERDSDPSELSDTSDSCSESIVARVPRALLRAKAQTAAARPLRQSRAAVRATSARITNRRRLRQRHARPLYMVYSAENLEKIKSSWLKYGDDKAKREFQEAYLEYVAKHDRAMRNRPPAHRLLPKAVECVDPDLLEYICRKGLKRSTGAKTPLQ